MNYDLARFWLHAGRNGHNQNASELDPACLQGVPKRFSLTLIITRIHYSTLVCVMISDIDLGLQICLFNTLEPPPFNVNPYQLDLP